MISPGGRNSFREIFIENLFTAGPVGRIPVIVANDRDPNRFWKHPEEKIHRKSFQIASPQPQSIKMMSFWISAHTRLLPTIQSKNHPLSWRGEEIFCFGWNSRMIGDRHLNQSRPTSARNCSWPIACTSPESIPASRHMISRSSAPKGGDGRE